MPPSYNEFKNSIMECQGFEQEDKRNLVKTRIQQEGVDIIVLMETELNGAVGDYTHQLGGEQVNEGIQMKAIGSKGGCFSCVGQKIM